MSENFQLNIIFTSDLHGSVLPIEYSDNRKSDKGLLRLLPAIRSFDENYRILIDLGDSIQGSPLMYFHHLNTKNFDNPVAKLLNHVSYDYFIPGNHDFNYGKEYLFDFVNNISATTLCSNIPDEFDKLVFKVGYDIKEFNNGLKVLTIGSTTKYIPNWENPNNIANMKFLDAYEETQKMARTYRDKVDLIICAYHGGLEKNLETGEDFVKDTGENQGYKIFSMIPEIDILLTGHQHRTLIHKQGHRMVVQAGSHGSKLGVIAVDFDSNKRIQELNPQFLEAKNYIVDEKDQKLIQKVEDATQLFLDQVIGEVVEGDLEIKDEFLARKEKHPIVGFINDIQLKATGAMISSTSLANVVSGFHKEITIRNVLSTYVYTNTLAVVEIDGANLKKYLEKCAEYFILVDGEIAANPRFSYPKLEHYNYDMIDGIDYVFDLRKPFGYRLVSVKYNGIEIDNETKLTLALNNYRAYGGGDFEMLRNLRIVKEIPFDVAELIIDYIREHRFLRITYKKNIVLLK